MKTIKTIMDTLKTAGKFKTPEEVDIFFEKSLNEVYNLGKNESNK